MYERLRDQWSTISIKTCICSCENRFRSFVCGEECSCYGALILGCIMRKGANIHDGMVTKTTGLTP